MDKCFSQSTGDGEMSQVTKKLPGSYHFDLVNRLSKNFKEKIMHIEFGQINWLSVVVCFIIGQIYLTLWFSVFFGTPWAKAYDSTKSKAEHTKEIPGYTYGIGALCMFILVLGIAILQAALGVETLGDALGVAAFISMAFVLATTVPGYAFLKRWNALVLAVGSQVTLIFILSAILAIW